MNKFNINKFIFAKRANFLGILFSLAKDLSVFSFIFCPSLKQELCQNKLINRKEKFKNYQQQLAKCQKNSTLTDRFAM